MQNRLFCIPKQIFNSMVHNVQIKIDNNKILFFIYTSQNQIELWSSLSKKNKQSKS